MNQAGVDILWKVGFRRDKAHNQLLHILAQSSNFRILRVYVSTRRGRCHVGLGSEISHCSLRQRLGEFIKSIRGAVLRVEFHYGISVGHILELL